MRRLSFSIGLASLAGSVASATVGTIAPSLTLDRTAVNTVRIFAYRMSLQQADDREKLGLVTQELRTRAEVAEARWRAAREAARVAGSRNTANAEQMKRLERLSSQREAAFAQAVEQLTDELAEKDADFKRRLAIAITDGNKLLETDDGRHAIELINMGGEKNISAGLDVLDAAAAVADTMDSLRKAERYRQRARVNLDVRGIGSATTEKITGLFEMVVFNDPESYQDWLELARLYRDANRLDASVNAADDAQKLASTNGQRAIAIIERADTHLLQSKNAETLLSFRKMQAELAIVKAMGAKRIADMPADQKGVLMLDVLHELVDSMDIFSGSSALAADDYNVADSLLAEPDQSLTEPERLRWRAKCSLRIAVAETADVKITLIHLFRDALNQSLPPRGTAITESQLSNIFSIKVENYVEGFRSKILPYLQSKSANVQGQITNLLGEIKTLGVIDRSASTQIEIGHEFCQVLALEQSITPEGDQNKSSSLKDQIDVIAPFIDLLVQKNADLTLAKRLKADYLYVAGVNLSGTADKAAALAQFKESGAIYADLIEHDPSSATDRRALARVTARLAAIPNSGVSTQDALSVFEKLRADNMLAPADETEFAMLEMGAAMGSPVPILFSDVP